MSDIFSLKVEELASKIKDSQLTSVEICEAYLERIKKFEKDVKAWAHFDKKLLLEKAAESDEHRRSGKPLGPLHGIPIALKDIIGTVDMPTECGTVIRKGKSFSQNAEIVDLLLSARGDCNGAKQQLLSLPFLVHLKLLIHTIIQERQEVRLVDLLHQ